MRFDHLKKVSLFRKWSGGGGCRCSTSFKQSTIGRPVLMELVKAFLTASDSIVLKPVAHPKAAHTLMKLVEQPIPVNIHLLITNHYLLHHYMYTVCSKFSRFVIPWKYVMILRPEAFSYQKHQIWIAWIPVEYALVIYEIFHFDSIDCTHLSFGWIPQTMDALLMSQEPFSTSAYLKNPIMKIEFVIESPQYSTGVLIGRSKNNIGYKIQ